MSVRSHVLPLFNQSLVCVLHISCRDKQTDEYSCVMLYWKCGALWLYSFPVALLHLLLYHCCQSHTCVNEYCTGFFNVCLSTVILIRVQLYYVVDMNTTNRGNHQCFVVLFIVFVLEHFDISQAVQTHSDDIRNFNLLLLESFETTSAHLFLHSLGWLGSWFILVTMLM